MTVAQRMRNGNLRHRRAALVLLSGPPGAGKTTFAAALRAELDAAYIESDAVRRKIARKPTYSFQESAKVFAVAEKLVRAALGGGKTAILDATNLRASERARFVAAAHECEAEYIPVRVTAPEGVIRARLARPREGNSSAGEEVWEMLRGREEWLAEPHLVVDTSEEIGPAVDAVVEWVQG